jgi:hypothetical protein
MAELLAETMKSLMHHPAWILAALGAVSGTLGSFALGFGYGDAPGLGLYMIPSGTWFGLVVGFGVRQWGGHSQGASWGAAATALVATWVGWELAVNLALQLDQHWLKAAAIPDAMRTYAPGFAAGAVGAFVTWAGAASSTRSLRRTSAAIAVVSVGAVLGLLLPLTSDYDYPVILLLPWQTAVAAVLGVGMTTERSPRDARPIAASG